MNVTCKVTVPKKLFDEQAFLKTAVDGLNWLVRETHKDFAATTRSTTFEEEQAHQEGDALVARVGTDDQRYADRNYGTPERVITSKPGGKPMAFQVGYTPATVPGRIGRGTPHRYGKWVVTRRVRHSIGARNFDKTIAEKRAPDLERVGLHAVDEAVK